MEQQQEIDEQQEAYEAAMIAQHGQESWDAYLAWSAEQEEAAEREMRGLSISLGPAHDPYGASCERERGHDGDHQGPNPFAEGRSLLWSGGGSCAGDPLPFSLR